MLILLILLGIIIFSLLKSSSGKRVILTTRSRRHKRNDRNRVKDIDFTKEDRKIIFDIFENKCFNCSSKKKLTIDHHYPLEKGYGLKNPDGSYNAVLLCSKCNMKKSNKMPDKFYSAEQLEILNEKYKLKRQRVEVYDIYHLKEEKAFVEFEYLGKKYKGIINDILEEEIKFLGMKNKIYLELDTGEQKEAFPIKWIKNMKKIVVSDWQFGKK